MLQHMVTLVIATRNVHKVGEIRAILGEAFRYQSLNDFPDAPKVIEDANTFAGNATKKAVELARWLSATHHSSLVTHHFFVLADDSGLEVDVLNGAPGVHSARFAALDRSTLTSSAELLRRRQQREVAAAAQRCANGETRRPLSLCAGACAGRSQCACRAEARRRRVAGLLR